MNFIKYLFVFTFILQTAAFAGSKDSVIQTDAVEIATRDEIAQALSQNSKLAQDSKAIRTIATQMLIAREIAKQLADKDKDKDSKQKFSIRRYIADISKWTVGLGVNTFWDITKLMIGLIIFSRFGVPIIQGAARGAIENILSTFSGIPLVGYGPWMLHKILRASGILN